MTENTRDIAELIHDAKFDTRKAQESLEQGASRIDVEDGLGNIEAAVQDIESQVAVIQDMVDSLSSGNLSIYRVLEGSEEAIDLLEGVIEILDAAEEQANPSDTTNGTLEIGGQTYEIALTPVEDEGDASEDGPEGLGDLLG